MSYDKILKLQKRFGILGKSDAITEIIEIIDQVAETDITVLIGGESGTGKELIADAIHKHSMRKHKPFIKVNCGAIPSGILESELFGHVKGAFTGASENRHGYFESADTGTIFLDEIGEMPIETQVKLLRVLEEGEFFPVGGSKPRQVDVRIVAATNRNLLEAIKKEKFRKDLYYRLKTITITAPSLKNHPEDIPELINKFALDFANRNSIPFKGFSPNSISLLQRFSWPGNIRELKNFVESMIVLQKGEVITSKMVEKQLYHAENEEVVANSPYLPIKVSKSTEQAERELILQQILLLRRDIKEIKDRFLEDESKLISPLKNKYTLQNFLSKPESQFNGTIEEGEEKIEEHEQDESIISAKFLGQVSMEDVEKELIEKTLKKFDFKKRQTANALQISERTLYRKINEYNLEK